LCRAAITLAITLEAPEVKPTLDEVTSEELLLRDYVLGIGYQ
jgi:hypothetical protein